MSTTANSTLISEGKTKRIRRTEAPHEVVLESFDSLTSGDAAKRAEIPEIAKYKTRQTVRVFRLLDKAGVPNAFIRQEGEREIRCDHCEMVPLELVIRRYAWGSILKREPALAISDTEALRFDVLRWEFFHKHSVALPPNVDSPTLIPEDEARERFLSEDGWPPNVYTDPLVQFGERWKLLPAKEPSDRASTLLEVDAVLSPGEVEDVVNRLMLPTFEALENAWATIDTQQGPVILVDLKIEVGRRLSDGELVVADVVDNDSWRIWPGGDPRNQLDKQSFRDGDPFSEVADNYKLVAMLLESWD